MDVTVTISNPVLISPEHFLVRYQEVPGGVFVDLGSHDNTPFVISGVDPGNYQLEVRFVNADGIICPKVFDPFVVPEDPPPDTCSCMVVQNVYVIRTCDNTAIIHIEFDGSQTGGCQYEAHYTEFDNVNPQTVLYGANQLPSSVEYTIPFSASQVAPRVTVNQICCSGQILTCFDELIHDIRNQDCGCIPPFITGGWINYDPATMQYSITVIFSSGGIISAPYTIAYDQQNTTNGDTGSFTEPTFGTYTFDIDPVVLPGVTPNLIYRIIVGNECGRDQIDVSVRGCDQNIEFNGGTNYPTQFTVMIPPIAGTHTIFFDAASVPDKLIMEIGGSPVIDTGYRGNITYQAALDASLAGLGDPPETITAATGPIAFNYNNPTAANYAQVKIYGPLDNTAWTLVVRCV